MQKHFAIVKGDEEVKMVGHDHICAHPGSAFLPELRKVLEILVNRVIGE